MRGSSDRETDGGLGSSGAFTSTSGSSERDTDGFGSSAVFTLSTRNTDAGLSTSSGRTGAITGLGVPPGRFRTGGGTRGTAGRAGMGTGTGVSASAKAAAVGNRLSGDLESALRTTALSHASSGELSGAAGSTLTCFINTSTPLVDVNTFVPVSSSCSTTPTAYTSERASTASPRICSGAM
jgi:hypothetical protein